MYFITSTKIYSKLPAYKGDGIPYCLPRIKTFEEEVSEWLTFDPLEAVYAKFKKAEQKS
jgi:hypothetical protein